MYPVHRISFRETGMFYVYQDIIYTKTTHKKREKHKWHSYNINHKELEAKKVMKKKILILMIATCLSGVFFGCSYNEAGEGESEETQNYSIKNEEQPDANKADSGLETDSENEGVDAIDNADVFGTVIDFSEAGCTLGKGSDTEDTKIVLADGTSANNEEQVSVIYGENTEFQIAVSTATDITLEQGSKEDVKKSSTIYVYGAKQEDGTFLATRVLIERFQR